MTNVSIIGFGQTEVRENWETSIRHLAWYAIEAALDNAHTSSIDALYVGNMLAGSIGTATLPLAEISLLRVMLPVSVFVAGVAFMMPYAQTAVLAPFPRLAGSASALMGFLQMGNGLLISTAGALLGDPLLAMSIFLPLMGAVAIGAGLASRASILAD